MDIKSALTEVSEITKEIGIRMGELKKLRERKSKLEETLETYLEKKELPGIKHGNVGVMLDNRKGHERKKKAEKVSDCVKFLSQAGIPNPEKVVKQLAELQKGNEIIVKKLKYLHN